MAKKFVRGITDIKNIEHQDFDTNNVNDLLSDGKHNYIHRKKENSEEYHNLTNNIKTLEAVQNGLLTVTNNNNTTNSAKLEVHHDQAKSQLLGSPNLTINVQNGENGSAELTTVDVNPEKVLQHNNLLTGYGISKIFSNNTSTLELQPTKATDGFNLNTEFKGKIYGEDLINSPATGWFVYENEFMTIGGRYILQTAKRYLISGETTNEEYIRTYVSGTWTNWSKQVTDQETLDATLATKQNTLVSNTSIGVDGTGLKQVYFGRTEYSVSDGYLETYYRSVAPNTNPGWDQEEINLIVKINKNVSNVTFELNSRDTTKFNSLITKYGQNGSVNISGCVFTLLDSDLTVSTSNNTDDNYVITFSDII